MIIDDNLNILVKLDNNVCGLFPRGRVEEVTLVEQVQLLMILVVSNDLQRLKVFSYPFYKTSE